MQQLAITHSAAEAMRTCARQVTTETGGVLVGTLAHPVVFAAGSPGPQSVKLPMSFSTDPAHDRRELAEARARVGRQLKYLGHWHKHPPQMISPSGGDLRQARELVRELARLGEDHPALLCIIVQDGADPQNSIFPYWLEDEQAEFKRLPWVLVADDAPDARQALHAEPLPLEPADDTHPWANPDFRFQLTRVGLARLKEEQTALEALGFSVTVRSRSRDRRVFFEINREMATSTRGEHYLCIFPPEYPLGAPRLLALPGGEDLPLTRVGWGWNSDMHVAEMLAASRQNKAGGGLTSPEYPQPANPPQSESLQPSGDQPAHTAPVQVPVTALPHPALVTPLQVKVIVHHASPRQAAALYTLGCLTAAAAILGLRHLQNRRKR